MNRNIGKRVKLIRTEDPYTKLKSGDRGTIIDVNTIDMRPIDKPFTQVWIKWDNGSTLALIRGEDQFRGLNISEKREEAKNEYGIR